MAGKVKVSSLPEFDAAEFLNGPDEIAGYLTAILEDGDSALLAAALGDIAKARGMSDIAASTGIAREALYKALRPGASPRLETITKVCNALGVKLVAQPTVSPAVGRM